MAKAQTDNHASVFSIVLIWMEGVLLRHRLLTNVVIHTFLFAAALMLAFLVRFDIATVSEEKTTIVSWFTAQYLPWLPVFVLLKLAIFAWMNLFRGDGSTPAFETSRTSSQPCLFSC